MIAMPLAVISAMAATAALAQSAPAQQQPAQQQRPAGGTREHTRLSPDAIQRLQEGRLAAARAALKMTDAQAKLWAPVEDKIKAGWAERRQRADEFRQQRAAGNQQAVPLPDRLDRASQRMAERAQKLKEFDAVLRPFNDSLSTEQKAVLGPVLAELRGGGHHHHGHHMMRQG